MVVLELILWLLIGSAVYSMFVYPLVLLVIGRVMRREPIRHEFEPRVSLIVSAFNEEAALAEKLDNTLALEYPADRLEVVVASDASTDRTDEIAGEYADRGVKLLRFDEGLGKTEVLNRTVPATTGEVVIFSDATGMWPPDAVRQLVSHLADPSVGCVSGRVGYSYDGSLAAKGFGGYQRYVRALRRAEADSGAAILASGSIHAVRRTAFAPGPADTVMDMVDPLHSAIRGFRNTFEENAISMEEVRFKTAEEFRARLRIGLRAWRFVTYAIPRLPILRSPLYSFQLISHKMLRWLIGPSLPIVLLLNILLFEHRAIYPLLLAAQALYYAVTLLGVVASNLGSRVPGVSTLVFFNSTNLAYLISLVRFARGDRASRWVPSR